MVRDQRTHKSKGFGFVSFLDSADFAKALREMQVWGRSPEEGDVGSKGDPGRGGALSGGYKGIMLAFIKIQVCDRNGTLTLKKK